MPIPLINKGDRELWVIGGTGARQRKWALPIYVDYFEAKISEHVTRIFASVTPAYNMNPDQSMALENRLLPYVYRSTGGNKVITKTALTEIATKAPGITPAFYVDWPSGDDETPEPLEDDAIDPEIYKQPNCTEAFLEYVQVETNVVPMPTLKLVWKAIVQCSMRWLAEKKKPIDFGFIELLPVPYRVNWQQMLKAMHPRSAWIATTPLFNQDKRDGMLAEVGLMQNMSNCVLLSMNHKTNCIYWRVELAHRKEWWSAMEHIEESHREKSGPAVYAKHVSSQIKKRRAKMVEVYSKWCKEAGRAAGRLDNGSVFGSKVIIPWRYSGAIKPINPPCGPVEATIDITGAEESVPEGQKAMALEAVERLL